MAARAVCPFCFAAIIEDLVAEPTEGVGRLVQPGVYPDLNFSLTIVAHVYPDRNLSIGGAANLGNRRYIKLDSAWVDCGATSNRKGSPYKQKLAHRFPPMSWPYPIRTWIDLVQDWGQGRLFKLAWEQKSALFPQFWLLT